MSTTPAHELTVRRQRPEDDEPERVPLTWALVMRMIGLTDGYKTWRTWLFVLCASRAIQLPVLAWMLAHIIRGPIAHHDVKGGLLWTAGFIAMFISTEVTLYWRIRFAHQMGECVLRDLRNVMMRHLLSHPLAFFHARKHGSLISRMIGDIEQMRNGLQNNLFITLVQAGQMVGAAIAMLLIQPMLFLVLLAMAPIMWAINRHFRSRILDASRTQQESFSRVTAALAETVQGIRVTQGFAREETNAGIFSRLVYALADNVVRTSRLVALFLPLLELNAQAFLAALIAVGGWMAVATGGSADALDLVTFFFLANLFFNPITLIGTQLSEATLSMASAERYFRILDTAPAWQDTSTAKDCPPLQGKVVFSNVHFSYEPDRPVLHGVSFTAQPGEIIALVGHTGSGKSTVVSLLSKFYLPDSGEITVDGINLNAIRQQTLRAQMGFVFQSNFLFSGTLADNVRQGKPGATDEEVLAAFKALDCLDLIESLPEGIHTVLSERGRGLSVGQQQLVAFARALISNPRILVLDEATSAVDTLTESRLQVALYRLLKGRTSFVVAHRLSTIRNANQILVLDHGILIESGKHAELVAAGGTYARLDAEFSRRGV
jgi:ATP-binding cassette subfamily B protein